MTIVERFCLALIIVMTFTATVYAGPAYPPELAQVVPNYPNGEIHMTAKKGNETNAAILAKGVTDPDVVFDFYKKSLLGKGWSVDMEMRNSMMAVMNFVKDGKLLIVGLMDHKQPQNTGIMINLTLEPGKQVSQKETPPKPAPATEPGNAEETAAKTEEKTAVPLNQNSGDFIDNQDGTVTQSSTNLVWQQADDGKKRSWHESVTYCEDLGLAGSNDWRLPEKDELSTLKETPLLSTQADYYWTKTHKKAGTILAWVIGFMKSGSGPKEHNKAMKHYVRCVHD